MKIYNVTKGQLITILMCGMFFWSVVLYKLLDAYEPSLWLQGFSILVPGFLFFFFLGWYQQNKSPHILNNTATMPTLEIKFYSISTTRLILLSFFTLDIFLIYWFIKNWELIRKQEQLKINPFWRGLFSIVFCDSFFKKILVYAKAQGYNTSVKIKAHLLAIIYIIGALMTRAINKYTPRENELLIYTVSWIAFSVLTYIPIVIIQKAINYNNSKIIPNFPVKTSFSGREMIIVLFGLGLFVLMLFTGIYQGYKESMQNQNTSTSQSPEQFSKIQSTSSKEPVNRDRVEDMKCYLSTNQYYKDNFSQLTQDMRVDIPPRHKYIPEKHLCLMLLGYGSGNYSRELIHDVYEKKELANYEFGGIEGSENGDFGELIYFKKLYFGF